MQPTLYRHRCTKGTPSPHGGYATQTAHIEVTNGPRAVYLTVGDTEIAISSHVALQLIQSLQGAVTEHFYSKAVLPTRLDELLER